MHNPEQSLPFRDPIVFEMNGHRHVMSGEEAEAIERSGYSTWQDYSYFPGSWPEPNTAVVPLMDARPGKVEPLDTVLLNQQSRSPFKFESLGNIHYRPARVTACYKSANKGFGAARFANFVDHPRVCTICLNHYLKGA